MAFPPNPHGIARIARGVLSQAAQTKARDAQATEEKLSPAVQRRTQIYTYFTVPDGQTKLLYSAEQWTRIRIELEDAGPVAIGTAQELGNVLQGVGILLETNELLEFDLPRGDRLYIVAGTLNRVKFIAQPIPWQEQILKSTIAVAQYTQQLFQSLTKK